MLPALSGSGVTVTLDDSPLWENAVNNNGTTANINDYVIHQQDVESVVNALWAGGADALMIMDQRVLFNSAVICSGNVLSLHGKKYSPPFTISAIGDPVWHWLQGGECRGPSVPRYRRLAAAVEICHGRYVKDHR